jgi:hypothetical protein
MAVLLLTSASASLAQTSVQAPGFTETEYVIGRLQAARCNLINGHETTACFQLGVLSDKVSQGNRAEIKPVFSFCYYGGNAKDTAYKIEMFLRASSILPESCNPVTN